MFIIKKKSNKFNLISQPSKRDKNEMKKKILNDIFRYKLFINYFK